MASKQTGLQARIQGCTKKIMELGSLSTDAFDEYKNISQKQLFKQLERANQVGSDIFGGKLGRDFKTLFLAQSEMLKYTYFICIPDSPI